MQNDLARIKRTNHAMQFIENVLRRFSIVPLKQRQPHHLRQYVFFADLHLHHIALRRRNLTREKRVACLHVCHVSNKASPNAYGKTQQQKTRHERVYSRNVPSYCPFYFGNWRFLFETNLRGLRMPAIISKKTVADATKAAPFHIRQLSDSRPPVRSCFKLPSVHPQDNRRFCNILHCRDEISRKKDVPVGITGGDIRLDRQIHHRRDDDTHNPRQQSEPSEMTALPFCQHRFYSPVSSKWQHPFQ